MCPRILVLAILIGGLWLFAVVDDHSRRLNADAERLKAQNELLAQQMYALDDVDPVTGKNQVTLLIEKAVAIEGVDWNDAEVTAMTRICWRESRYNPHLQNPRSTAFGLYQFLDSTWKSYGIDKTTDPLLQTIAAVRYIKARYGTPRKALAFHLVKHEVNGEMVHYY
jgi:hypothetical protein